MSDPGSEKAPAKKRASSKSKKEEAPGAGEAEAPKTRKPRAKAEAKPEAKAEPKAKAPAVAARPTQPPKAEKAPIKKAGTQAPKRETRTRFIKVAEVEQQWFLFDAKGKTLGRLATEIAKVLIGKHKPSYTPNIDMGDGVIVVNADAVKVTGLKEARKVYRYYTGYIGGQREYIYRDMKAKKPTYILWHAVRGMMPKSRLGKQQMRKLRLFAEAEHPHQAQKPIKVEI